MIEVIFVPHLDLSYGQLASLDYSSYKRFRKVFHILEHESTLASATASSNKKNEILNQNSLGSIDRYLRSRSIVRTPLEEVGSKCDWNIK